MSERRSNRSKKSIDYAKFSENGDDDDDDFQIIRSTSEKRQKTSEGKSEKKRKKTSKDKDGSSQNFSEKSFSEVPATPSNKRLSVDEKVFERQLKIVLERSVCDAHIASKRAAENCDDDDETDFQPSTKILKKKEPSVEKKLCDSVKDSDLGSIENKGSSPLLTDKKPHNADHPSSHDVKKSEFSKSCSEKEHDDNETAEVPCETISPKVEESDDDLTKVSSSVPTSKSFKTKDIKLSKAVANISAAITPPKKSVRCNQSQVTMAESNNQRGQLDLSLISPVKKSSQSLLPSKGLRLGLSRKVSIKPLHPEAKLVS